MSSFLMVNLSELEEVSSRSFALSFFFVALVDLPFSMIGVDYFHSALAEQILCLVVLYSDGFLDISPNVNEGSSERRFFSILKKLPLLFQQEIVCKLFTSSKVSEISDQTFQDTLRYYC